MGVDAWAVGDIGAQKRRDYTVIGPGTGLGVAIQTPHGEVVPSEAGHVQFAPTDSHEIELLRRPQTRQTRQTLPPMSRPAVRLRT